MAACSRLSGLTRMWAEEPAREIVGGCPGAGLGFRDPGQGKANVIGPGPRISLPLPGREKSVLHARRPRAVLYNSRDGLKTCSCYISRGLIESRPLKFRFLALFFPSSLFLY